MAVEMEGFVMVQQPVENSAEDDEFISHEKENRELEQDLGVADSLKFWSHGDESAATEENGVTDFSGPKDIGEEWPAPQQIHSFYFVRLRRSDDPNIKPEMDKLDKEMNQKNEARIQLTNAIRAKRSERAELISQIKTLKQNNKQIQSILDEKIKEIEPLQHALGKLRTSNIAGRGGLCSSEEELNKMIYSLQYRIQHESIPFTEEKQIVREIKQLEGTREKVIADAALRAKVQGSVGKKEAIQEQVKLISEDLDGVKKERQAIRSKIKEVEDALKAIDKDILSLEEEKGAVTQKREKTFESIQQLRRQRDEGNTSFYESRQIMTKAQELAVKKDINALQELSHTEVENFMSHWNKDRAFSDDYEKRLLRSLDIRQLSRDGRMRNPDEKPLLEEPKPTENDTLPNGSVEQAKEEGLPNQKVQKETKNRGRDLKSNLDNKDFEDTSEYEFENPQKETSTKEPAIDPEKLKEIKREEEIAKAKLALERKKKLAEKAAAKAVKKAEMEAEKKLKGHEKKAKKETDEVVEATEQENVNGSDAEISAPVKEKAQKESSTRYRSRTKGPEAIPKAIIKRKKANNFWTWFTCSALFILVTLVLGLQYLS
ncbi:PREDICTED: proton pump-interactor 1-like isoform X2 [Lupinus angustifolius]|uniref:proton pump-interactor 1-like isoform X2 n=1 Tax=Lupinus angustifolius TaxID=3871 RepID=UPI00092EBE22|nr:PREDICTED: proton pump-interactor 1-like isoform X2 [Lupinus angustifolius]